MDPGETSQAEAPDPLELLALSFKGLANAKRLKLLRFLVEPHYLEEIASHLGVARQTAQEHLTQLVELGLVRSVKGKSDHAAVTSYVVIPSRFFTIQMEFAAIGELESEADEKIRMTTMRDAPGPDVKADEDLPRLAIVHGMRVGRIVLLKGDGPWLIGRDATATLQVDFDAFASQRHAEVRRAATGGFELADLYSSNGTSIDWKRMPRGAVAPLASGSLVKVGKTILHFRKP